jgi:YHS domain-containing protein
MKARLFVAALAVAGLIVGASLNGEDKADPLAGVKCPVSGKKINPEAKVEYKEGHVYFCCEGCPAAFKEDTAKFATKANHQLVATGQYTEKVCPITGNKLNAETAIDLGGAKVAFCCNNCKGKVEKAEGDAKLELVFSDKAFEKGFEKAKAE